MNVDRDIQNLLKIVEKGYHSVEESIHRFMESLPGYEFRYHRPLTIKTYERCLLKDPQCFLNFMNKRGISRIDCVGKDDLEFYKNDILNHVEPRTAMKYLTATRQVFKFVTKIGWLDENIAANLEMPKPTVQKRIEVIRPEVIELLLDGSFGLNPFTRARNRLVLFLFLNRGMHPKELPGITLNDIEAYRDLHIVSVCGKKGRWREVMLDPVTDKALLDYSVERGKYISWRGSRDERLLLASNPRPDGSYEMSIGGVSGIIKRITLQLQREGCMYSLKNVTPNIMRHTAETADWERAENLPVHHPEMSITAQYGNSPRIALKHYVVRSRRNAYTLIKGGSLIDKAQEGDSDAIRQLDDLRYRMPESEPRFNNPGDGI